MVLSNEPFGFITGGLASPQRRPYLLGSDDSCRCACSLVRGAVHPRYQGNNGSAIRGVAFCSAFSAGAELDQLRNRFFAGSILPRSRRKRCPTNRGSIPSPTRTDSRARGVRKIPHWRAVHWKWSLHGTRRTLGPNWSRFGFVSWAIVPTVTHSRSKPGAGRGCCGSIGSL